MKILIVGYGNIGRHTYNEFISLKPDIYDPFIPEYSEKVGTLYDFAFVCVPTEKKEDGSCDISIVEKAVSETNAKIIVIKSAIPVGTADFLMVKYGKTIVVSPEYYGTTQHSEDSPDFLILGGEKKICNEVAELFYKVKSGTFRIKFTDAKTAELSKYMENCFLALKVTFCCEFFQIAERFGISYPQLREIFIMDRRMGDSHTFVYPDKPYYDSHCLNKDIPALINFANTAGVDTPLMKAMHEINGHVKERVFSG